MLIKSAFDCQCKSLAGIEKLTVFLPFSLDGWCSTLRSNGGVSLAVLARLGAHLH
jgi:hypothetical protein